MIATQRFTLTPIALNNRHSTTERCIYILHQQLCSFSFDVMWWCLRPMNITTFSWFNFHLSFLVHRICYFARMFAVFTLYTAHTAYIVYTVYRAMLQSHNMIALTNFTFIELNRNIYNAHKRKNDAHFNRSIFNGFKLWFRFFSSSLSWAFGLWTAVCLLIFKCAMKTIIIFIHI